jgi:hypothetical protein
MLADSPKRRTDGGLGKIICDKIMGFFYDFALHDFASLFSANWK